jgi:superfamily II DNA or RNA helicase
MWGRKCFPKWLVLVGSPALAEQLCESFVRAEKRAKSIRLPSLDYQRYITTYGRATETQLREAHILIVDECHQIPSPTRMEQINRCDSSLFRIGLSATPFMRSDSSNMWVAALLGPGLAAVPVSQMVAAGVLAKPVIAQRR